jgi:hypothetical protein
VISQPAGLFAAQFTPSGTAALFSASMRVASVILVAEHAWAITRADFTFEASYVTGRVSSWSH